MAKIEKLFKLSEAEIKILLYLLQHERAYIRELTSKLGISPATVQKSVEILSNLELVRILREDRRKYLYLTQKGERVAKKYRQIARML